VYIACGKEQNNRRHMTRTGSMDEGRDGILQENVRHTTAELVGQLGASEATVQRRVETLIQQDP
jgi:response regulator of citrate/malate metabolism